jgi:hypothetical protein
MHDDLIHDFPYYVDNIVDELCIAKRLRWHSHSTKPEKTLASHWLMPASRWLTLYSHSTTLAKNASKSLVNVIQLK